MARMRTGLLVALALVASHRPLPSHAAVDPTAPLYDPSRVIDIALEVGEDDWNRLCAQKRTFVSLFRGACLSKPFDNPFTWFPATVSIDGQRREHAGVRKKGFLGSLDTLKPALKIDLTEFGPNAPVHGTRRLTLNNAKQDPSLIRQCLGYRLFALAGVPAPRCNFARVSVNGRNLGVYANVEEVRKPMLARHFADDDGNLYEGTVSDFHPALIGTFEKQTNESTNDGSDLAAVVAALAAPDAELEDALGAIVDLEAFVKLWAMEALVGHWDGYAGNRNNFYLYHDPASGRFHFIPWGIDTILSEGYPIASLNPGANKAMFAYSAITRRLVELPSMRARYAARMGDLLGSVWNEAAILAEIDAMHALIGPHAGDLTEAIAPVRAFVLAQRARVVADLAAAPAFPPLTIVDFCLDPTGHVEGAFAATWRLPAPDGAASLDARIEGDVFASSRGAAVAGLPAGDPNPHLGVLDLTFELAGGGAATMSMVLDSTRLRPGARLAIDGQEVDATLAIDDAGTPFQFLDRGTLAILYASTTPGAMVCGTYEATTLAFLFALLAGPGVDATSAAAATPATGPRTPRRGPGEVLRACKPGAG